MASGIPEKVYLQKYEEKDFFEQYKDIYFF